MILKIMQCELGISRNYYDPLNENLLGRIFSDLSDVGGINLSGKTPPGFDWKALSNVVWSCKPEMKVLTYISTQLLELL